MKRVGHWVLRYVLLTLDYAVSGFFWGLPGMTISARCGIAQKSGERGFRAGCLRALGALLDKIDANHCVDAIDHDLERIAHTRDRLYPWRRGRGYFGES